MATRTRTPNDNPNPVQARKEAKSNAAVNEMRQILVRIMKGEVAMRVEVWKASAKTSSNEARAAKEAKEANRATAMREMKQIMVRIMKGEMVMRVEVWQMSAKLAALCKLKEAQQEIAIQTLQNEYGNEIASSLLEARKLEAEALLKVEAALHEQHAVEVDKLVAEMTKMKEKSALIRTRIPIFTLTFTLMQF